MKIILIISQTKSSKLILTPANIKLKVRRGGSRLSGQRQTPLKLIYVVQLQGREPSSPSSCFCIGDVVSQTKWHGLENSVTETQGRYKTKHNSPPLLDLVLGDISTSPLLRSSFENLGTISLIIQVSGSSSLKQNNIFLPIHSSAVMSSKRNNGLKRQNGKYPQILRWCQILFFLGTVSPLVTPRPRLQI